MVDPKTACFFNQSVCFCFLIVVLNLLAWQIFCFIDADALDLAESNVFGNQYPRSLNYSVIIAADLLSDGPASARPISEARIFRRVIEAAELFIFYHKPKTRI